MPTIREINSLNFSDFFSIFGTGNHLFLVPGALGTPVHCGNLIAFSKCFQTKGWAPYGRSGNLGTSKCPLLLPKDRQVCGRKATLCQALPDQIVLYSHWFPTVSSVSQVSKTSYPTRDPLVELVSRPSDQDKTPGLSANQET